MARRVGVAVLVLGVRVEPIPIDRVEDRRGVLQRAKVELRVDAGHLEREAPVELERHVLVRFVEELDRAQQVRLADVPVRSLRARHKVGLDAQRRRAGGATRAHRRRVQQVVHDADGEEAEH